MRPFVESAYVAVETSTLSISRRIFKHPLVAFAAIMAFVPCVSLAGAQDLPDVAQGFQPYVAYHDAGFDHVNTLNGSLTIRIPIVSYPQLGTLKLSYSMYYNTFGFQDLELCSAAYTPNPPTPPPTDPDPDPDPGNPDPTQPDPDPIAPAPPLKSGCQGRISVVPNGVLRTTQYGPQLKMDQAVLAGGNSAPVSTSQYEPTIMGRFYVMGADNAEHPLAPTSQGYQALDESGYAFVPSSAPAYGNNLGVESIPFPGPVYPNNIVMEPAAGTIYDASGVAYTPSGMTDRDGNSITFSGVTTDSVGRQIPGLSAVDTSQCPTLPGAQFQPLVSASQWNVPGVGGTSTSYTFCYVNVNILTHITLSTGGLDPEALQVNRTVPMVQSIVLPNGTYWGFIYDSNDPNATWRYNPLPTPGSGQLMSMIYPTGGSVNYTYAYSPGFCGAQRSSGVAAYGAAIYLDQPQVMTRTTMDAAGNVIGQWQYTYPFTNNTGAGTGSILSPSGNLTVMKFTADNTASPYGGNESCSLLDAGQDVYQGGSTSGTLLSSTTKTYTFPAVNGLPWASAARESLTTTMIPNVGTSSVQTNYGAQVNFGEISCDYTGASCAAAGSYPAPLGGPTSIVYTDFSGNVLKQSATQYQWQANPAYLEANLVDLPASTAIEDANGNTLASTSYTYDESGYVPSPSATPGHATSISKSLNTGNPSVTHQGWNGNGMMTLTLDPDANQGNAAHLNSQGHTTDHVYGACNGSAISSSTNSLNQQVSATYDCNTGLLTSLTDMNGKTTTVGTPNTPGYDSMRRLVNMTYPDGGSVSFNYMDAQNTVQETVVASPNPTQTTTVNFDSFGREIHRSVADVPQSDLIDTTYDSEGRVATVSNPYRTPSDSIYGITSYTYDALNRKTLMQNPDGSSIQTCYDGQMTTGQSICAQNTSSMPAQSWVDSNDELGNHWQHVSDALGRLVAVMEPDPSAGAPALETDYTYSPLGDLTLVNQKGSATDTPRVRTFTYDSQSRLVCAANPESSSGTCPTSATGTIPSGVLAYSYDANGNVTLKTDARGISTQTQYDGLNRVVSKTYSDGVTPAVQYTYDASPIMGASMTLGRLTSEVLSSNGTVVSRRSPFAYDSMGRILALQECASTMCAQAPFQLAYTYDAAGKVLTSNNAIPNAPFNGTNALPLTFSLTNDQVGRLATLQSSWSDATVHPGTLFSATSTSLAGPSYDAANHLINATLGVLSGASLPVATLMRTYDDRLRPMSEIDNASAVLQQASTNSLGAIAITGTEGHAAGTATPGTGQITITGSDGSHTTCVNGRNGTRICNTLSDTGSLVVTVNGYQATANYGAGDNDQTVAATMATALSASGSPVTASSSNNVVTMTSIATGTASNYAFSISNSADFSGTDSGATLVGGSAGVGAYDTGYVTVSVNGVSMNVNWGQNDSQQSIASGIQTAIQNNSQVNALVSASPSGGTVSLTSKPTGTAANFPVSCSVTDTASQTASFSVNCSGMAGGTNAGYGSQTAYSYQIAQNGGYAPNGNVLSATDSVTGAWSYGYDHLNRLTGGSGQSGMYNGQMPVQGIALAWSYDSFGNRLTQSSSVSQIQAMTTVVGANNQLVSSTAAPNGVTYDAAGNVLNDGVNQYAYDAEERICAVHSSQGYTGYLYDGEGNRVAKGFINGLNCNLATNGFILTNSYANDLSGEKITELAGSQWLHSNVFANGQLLATYEGGDTYFAFNDWLGTKRAELTPDGCLKTFGSLPFGDDLTSVGPCDDATEQHFTGKERDAESGLDYFGARYYASNMGRWMSPDWSAKAEPVPYAKLEDPQSLNLYVYARNNPLRNVDLDGHCDSSANATAATKCQKLSDLHASSDYKDKLKKLEGEGKNHDPLLTYKDIGDGHHTVGWGHVDDSKKLGTAITKDDAQKLFDDDVSANETSTRKTLVSNGNHDFSQGEFDALVDLQFNGNLLNSSSSPTLMKAINDGDYDTLSKNLRYTMATDSNGKKVQMGGLVDRSNAREDMVKGKY